MDTFCTRQWPVRKGGEGLLTVVVEAVVVVVKGEVVDGSHLLIEAIYSFMYWFVDLRTCKHMCVCGGGFSNMMGEGKGGEEPGSRGGRGTGEIP
jgi:hypothetical protein